MSQSMRGGGGFRGKFKGNRGRQPPYNRPPGQSGASGSPGAGYRRFQRNDGASSGNNEKSFVEAPEVGETNIAEPKMNSGAGETPHKPAGDHTFGASGHTPSEAGPGVGEGARSGGKGKKYSVKARLFVGNLPRDTSQETVKQMFQEFGEVKEVFVQKEKNFGFVRMAYRSDAEDAVAALDGKSVKGREMKVRFAASNSSVKVSNLHPVVSNELLESAFAMFGEVEKAVVVTDDRGKSLGYGIVDFTRKGFAQNAIRRCNEDHFLLTKSPMPVLVAEYIRDNDEEGQPDKNIPKNNIYRVEYEQEPRFASPSSLEHAVATQWKMAYESEKRQREELEQHLRQARNSLVNEMESIKEQHQTELLRQELAHHQQEQLRLVQQLRMRQGNLASLPSGAGGGLLEPSVSVGGGMPSLFPSPPTERPPVPEQAVMDPNLAMPGASAAPPLNIPLPVSGGPGGHIGGPGGPIGGPGGHIGGPGGLLLPPPLMGQNFP